MTLALSDAKVVTPLEVIHPGLVVIAGDGTIAYVGPPENAPSADVETLALDGLVVTPGFTDIHTHGGDGVTFGQGDDLQGDLRTYTGWVASTGVTGFLCSVAAPDPAALQALVRSYVELFEQATFTGARPLGLHLEGPYLNPEKKGAFNEAWLRRPLIDEVRELLEAGQGWIRQMTLAPELPQATEVASLLRSAGVVASLGHSNTDYATAAAGTGGGFRARHAHIQRPTRIPPPGAGRPRCRAELRPRHGGAHRRHRPRPPRGNEGDGALPWIGSRRPHHGRYGCGGSWRR